MGTRSARVSAVVGAVLLVVTAAWLTAGRWAFARYPSDFHITLEYDGTVSQHVDLATGRPLTPPATVPLRISRNLDVSRSSLREATVVEEITTRVGTAESQALHSYALDRRSMELKGGTTSWAYASTNKVDRDGTYRVNLPMGITENSTAAIWNNETGQRYTLDGQGVPYEADGVKLLRFRGHLDAAALTAPARDSLRLPSTATVQQLAPQLAAAGIDLARLQAGLSAILTPAEVAGLTAALGTPVPLNYTFSFRGAIGVEPATGGIVELSDVQESIAVKPDLSGLAALQPILAGHAGEPVVQQLTAALGRVATAPPTPVLDVDYAQTEKSVGVAAQKAQEMRSSLRLVNTTIPWGLGAAGLLCLVVAAVLWVTRPTRPAHRRVRSTEGGDRIRPVIDIREEQHDAGRAVAGGARR